MSFTVAPLIPAYKLSSTEVQNLLDRLPHGYETPTVIHNDEDQNLSLFLESLAKNKRINLLSIPFQLGKSEALRRGLCNVLETTAADVIIQVDGDLKQPPEDIVGIVQRLSESGAQMVVANRYGLQDMAGQVHRVTLSGLVSTIIKRITGYKLADITCGTRGYVRDLGSIFSRKICSFGYGLEIEEILISSLYGFLVDECPTRANRQADATNAGKLEDNIFALIIYANDFDYSLDIRESLHFMLAKIKQRRSFDLKMQVFGGTGIARFEYMGDSSIPVINSYASGTDIDGYSLSYIS